MAITNGYTTLDALKAYLDITDPDSDTLLEGRVEAASRAIDGWCGRVFFTVTEARVFTAQEFDSLSVPDVLSVTSVETDDAGDRQYSTTWLTTDYELDGINDSGESYREIATTPQGTRTFPTIRRGVRVTGGWGYATEVPHAIREACLLQATRYYKRKDAPFGIAGNSEAGQLQTISSIDPDIKPLLAPFRRMTVVGV